MARETGGGTPDATGITGGVTMVRVHDVTIDM